MAALAAAAGQAMREERVGCADAGGAPSCADCFAAHSMANALSLVAGRGGPRGKVLHDHHRQQEDHSARKPAGRRQGGCARACACGMCMWAGKGGADGGSGACAAGTCAAKEDTAATNRRATHRPAYCSSSFHRLNVSSLYSSSAPPAAAREAAARDAAQAPHLPKLTSSPTWDWRTQFACVQTPRPAPTAGDRSVEPEGAQVGMQAQLRRHQQDGVNDGAQQRGRGDPGWRGVRLAAGCSTAGVH